MKRIKQIIKTKMTIHKALLRLLTKKDFDDITFTEIAQEANLVRMTVYRHFKEKEEIILFGLNEEASIITEKMEQLKNPTLKDLLSFRFQFIKETPFTYTMFKDKRIFSIASQVGIQNWFQFADIIPKFDDPFLPTFLICGIEAITEEWAQKGMKEKPEEMAERVLKVIDALQKAF